jgi:hypothetical protein
MDSGLRRNDTVRLDGLVLGDAPNHRTSSSGLTRGDFTCGALGQCKALKPEGDGWWVARNLVLA